MKFNTYLIIQFCPSLINWVSLCDWCFQAQFLQEITLRCVMWINCVGFVLIRSSIWSFAAPQVKEISSRTTLQSLTWVRIDTEEVIGVAVGFISSFEIWQWFHDLDLFILFRIIWFVNAQVKMSILSCLAHKIRLLIFKKLPQM